MSCKTDLLNSFPGLQWIRPSSRDYTSLARESKGPPSDRAISDHPVTLQTPGSHHAEEDTFRGEVNITLYSFPCSFCLKTMCQFLDTSPRVNTWSLEAFLLGVKGYDTGENRTRQSTGCSCKSFGQVFRYMITQVPIGSSAIVTSYWSPSPSLRSAGGRVRIGLKPAGSPIF